MNIGRKDLVHHPIYADCTAILSNVSEVLVDEAWSAALFSSVYLMGNICWPDCLNESFIFGSGRLEINQGSGDTWDFERGICHFLAWLSALRERATTGWPVPGYRFGLLQVCLLKVVSFVILTLKESIAFTNETLKLRYPHVFFFPFPSFRVYITKAEQQGINLGHWQGGVHTSLWCTYLGVMMGTSRKETYVLLR